MSTSFFHALVTGATGGIGHGICLSMIERSRHSGEKLCLTVTSSKAGDRLDSLVAELRDMGVEVHGLSGDLTQPDHCRQIVADAISKVGDIDALVCVAGAASAAKLADLSVDQWDRSFDLNVRSVFLMAQAARSSLLKTRGSITAIGSMSGLHPHPGLGAYSSAKAALAMLCRQLAQEWGPDGIRTNCISPGMIRTPLTEAIYANSEVLRQREAIVPMGRIGVPKDIGQAVAYLTSAGGSYVNGVNLVIDGGVADHMLAMIPGRPDKHAVSPS